MLDFLVTSRARRALVNVLLTGELEGSVSEVARRARIRPSTAERELTRMEACGLVAFERRGKEKLVRARTAAPVEALRALSRTPGRAKAKRQVRLADARVRAALSRYGAPLFADEAAAEPLPGLEETLAAALRLAHEDAPVAGNVPVVLWRNRNVDTAELSRLAVRAGEGQTLGFFLELTDELAGEDVFGNAAQALRDKRVSRPRNFFSRDGRFGPYEEELALAATPEVARRWHYLMNMSLDSFRSYFRKGTEPRVDLAAT